MALLKRAKFLVRALLSWTRGRPLPVADRTGRLRASITPFGDLMPAIAGGDDGGAKDKGDPDPEDKDKGDPDPEDDKDKGDPDPEDDDDKVSRDDDWKAKARKHERALKNERKRREELEGKLKAREDADKSDHEKAVEAARQEGEKKAREAAEADRRKDRLETAVIRAASKGVKLKLSDGDKEVEKTLRAEDPEDVQVFIERRLESGAIDEDELFSEDGKVNAEAVEEAVAELLREKPRLAADAEGRRRSGDPDSRKGEPASEDLEGMSPEDHAKRKYAKAS